MFRERNQEAPGSTHSPPCSHRTDGAEVPKVWVSEERRGVPVLFFFFEGESSGEKMERNQSRERTFSRRRASHNKP